MEPQHENLDFLAAVVEQYVAEMAEKIKKRGKAADNIVYRRLTREIVEDWERISLCIEAMCILASSKTK